MSLPTDTPIALLNGNFIPFSDAKLPIYDLGVMQGATVTERLRTFDYQAYQLREHLDRMRESLELCEIDYLLDLKEISEQIQTLISHNAPLSGKRELAVVLFVTAGQGISDSNGLIRESAPTMCIYTSPLPIELWRNWYRSGVRLTIPELKQIPHQSMSPHIKQRSRLNWYLADRQAKAIEPHSQALMKDLHGFVTETASGNVFIVSSGVLLTPRRERTLAGIAQAHVLKLAKSLDMEVSEQNLTPEDVLEAEEAFLTSSTFCLVPVASVNQTPIGKQFPGPVTLHLTSAWEKQVGKKFASTW